MELKSYRPFHHGTAVRRLWQETLGASYPVPERVFAQCTSDRPTYTPGDGLVACTGNTVIGFGIVEVARNCTGNTSSMGFIAALFVHPQHQRQGVGAAILAALEERLRREHCATARVGMGPSRFWTGVPADLVPAAAFFRQAGYALDGEAWDLFVDLSDGPLPQRYAGRLAALGIEATTATPASLAAVVEFEQREFPGWLPNMLRMAGAGDVGNIFFLRCADEVVGTAQCYTPASRWRGPNLVWERLHGPGLGGCGGVGIAKAWRGRGLGAAMCEAAIEFVRRSGADGCCIDWTGLVDFYAKTGAKPWRRFLQGAKNLTGNSIGGPSDDS